MELTFFKFPEEFIKEWLLSGKDLYFYDAEIKQRHNVKDQDLSELLRKSQRETDSYFQVLVKDYQSVTDNDLILAVAEQNRDLLLALDRFEERKEKYEKFFKKEWNYLLELSQAMKKNDFLPVLNLIQADLAHDPQTISVFASSVSETLEKLLRRDSALSRMIAFNYCCYKDLGYDERATLYDLLGAVILKDLGLSQNRAQDIFKKNDIFYKHPYYSLFLIKKLPFELSQQCYFFILDHHERRDGTGFPRQKTGDFFHPLCDVLKAGEWIFFENSKLSDYKKVLRDIGEKSQGAELINTSLLASLNLINSYLNE